MLNGIANEGKDVWVRKFGHNVQFAGYGLANFRVNQYTGK